MRASSMPSSSISPSSSRAVVFAGLVVELALGRLHVGVDDAFGARRQFGRHLFLGAAQDERIDQCAAAAGRAVIARAAFDRVGKLALEIVHAAQQARVEKGELRPQLEGVVFHRRAGHHQAVIGVEQPGRLGALRQRVLDGLRFIQDDVAGSGSCAESRYRAAWCRRWSGSCRTRRTMAVSLLRVLPIYSRKRSRA